MKIVGTIARYLLGLMFLVFGPNTFLHFLPMPLPSGQAGQFLVILTTTRYFYVVGSIMVAAGILLLANRYVPLALTLLGPLIVNFLLFHILMHRSAMIPAILATILWILVAWRVRFAFFGILQQRV
jgi:putative oxidoreductase